MLKLVAREVACPFCVTVIPRSAVEDEAGRATCPTCDEMTALFERVAPDPTLARARTQLRMPPSNHSIEHTWRLRCSGLLGWLGRFVQLDAAGFRRPVGFFVRDVHVPLEAIEAFVPAQWFRIVPRGRDSQPHAVLEGHDTLDVVCVDRSTHVVVHMERFSASLEQARRANEVLMRLRAPSGPFR